MRLKLLNCLFLVGIAGCSVGMAMEGKPEPDFSVIKVGATRGQVEIQLGAPIESEKLALGSADTYEVELGNAPDSVRAVAHGVMDLFTLGLWEIVGTSIESGKGEKKHILINYDENDYVVSLKRADPPKVEEDKKADNKNSAS